MSSLATSFGHGQSGKGLARHFSAGTAAPYLTEPDMLTLDLDKSSWDTLGEYPLWSALCSS